VLADGDGNAYLYGLGRLGEEGAAGWQYHHGDALGSVRQLTDGNGSITLSKSYRPYGEILNSAGNGSSSYGFTGEMTDNTGLIYLRARYMDPRVGRFLTKDVWPGDYFRPPSLNGWNYVEANPINFIDPTGLIRVDEDRTAKAFVQDLQNKYQVKVLVDWGFQITPIPVPTPPDQTQGRMETDCFWKDGEWTINELHTLWMGVISLSNAMGRAEKFFSTIGGVTVSQEPIEARALTWPHRIKFTSSPVSIDTWTVVHELAHAWDGNFGWKLSKKLEEYTGGYTSIFGSIYKWLRGECDRNKMLPGCNNSGYFYGGIPPAGSDANFNRKEDFAESVTAYVYPTEAQRKVVIYKEMKDYEFLYYSDYTKLPRWNFVNNLIEGTIIP
jgi:RHS repeat-associated protein